MRKRTDPLMLLAVLVVSGVILSHFVVFSQADKPSVRYSKWSPTSSQPRIIADTVENLSAPVLMQKSRQLVRIDPLKQQTH